jgi:hypothetical protein
MIGARTRMIRKDDLDHSPGSASMELNRWLGVILVTLMRSVRPGCY